MNPSVDAGNPPNKVARKILKFLIGAHCLVQWETMVPFKGRLCSSAELDLRQTWTRVKFQIWGRLLLGEFLVRDTETGFIRPCDSDDETHSGSADAYLDYPNLLWKCQLADGCKPFNIIVRMLGKPNWGGLCRRSMKAEG